MLDRGNVNLKILDPTGLSEHVTGVVGNFIAPGSYHIERHSDDFGLLECFKIVFDIYTLRPLRVFRLFLKQLIRLIKIINYQFADNDIIETKTVGQLQNQMLNSF